MRRKASASRRIRPLLSRRTGHGMCNGSSQMLRALTFGLAVLVSALAGVGSADLDPADPASWQLADADLYGLAVRGERIWAVGYWGTALRSEDAGATWSRAETHTSETLYGVDFADALHGWAVGAYGLLLRSSDGGRSWVRQASGVDTHLFAVSAVSETEAWAVGDLGVVLHVRDGTTWHRVELPEDVFGDEEPPDRIFNGVRFSDPEHGFLVGEFGTRLRSDDGGETWRSATAPEGAPPELYLYGIDTDGPQRAAAAGLAGSVLVTSDGGVVWEARHTGSSAPMYDVAWTPDGGVAVGDRGEIYLTRDGGASWISPQHPRLFRWLIAVRADAGVLYAVGEKGVVLRSGDAGATWTQLR